MKKFRGLAGLASVAALALVPMLMASQSETTRAQATAKIAGTTLVAASELKWTPMAGLEGAMQAAVVGDPAKEAHRVFYKFPVGLKAPMHTHTYGDRGVIVSGTLSLTPEGGAAKKLPPGSFFSMAGGTKHVTAVEGDAPCVFFVEREGPFDVVLAEPASGK